MRLIRAERENGLPVLLNADAIEFMMENERCLFVHLRSGQALRLAKRHLSDFLATAQSPGKEAKN